ncbi:MAG: hypothetical protein QXS68_06500, partial [Candidatus Methanomethylicaceae archaeon]
GSAVSYGYNNTIRPLAQTAREIPVVERLAQKIEDNVPGLAREGVQNLQTSWDWTARQIGSLLGYNPSAPPEPSPDIQAADKAVQPTIGSIDPGQNPVARGYQQLREKLYNSVTNLDPNKKLSLPEVLGLVAAQEQLSKTMGNPETDRISRLLQSMVQNEPKGGSSEAVRHYWSRQLDNMRARGIKEFMTYADQEAWDQLHSQLNRPSSRTNLEEVLRQIDQLKEKYEAQRKQTLQAIQQRINLLGG